MRVLKSALILLALAYAAGAQDASTESNMDPVSDEIAQAQIEKAARREAAKKKKTQMESCLTLVRSFYGKDEEVIQATINAHPTKDKQRFLSKILSQMMIKCNSVINEDQIAKL